MLIDHMDIDTDFPLTVKESDGQCDAIDTLIAAYKSEKFPHSWIITGPKGIGKSQLAISLAHFILSNPEALSAPDKLPAALAQDHISAQIKSNSHPDLLIVKRQLNTKTGKLRQDIGVDDARAVSKFFSRHAAAGGWRICIIDTADDLNRPAANALLKIVEEPPQNCLILFISNAIGRLLPTLRSRCRTLRCAALTPQEIKSALKDMASEQGASSDLEIIAALCDGSLSQAHKLWTGGLPIYQDMMTCLESLPDADWGQINKFITSLSGAANRDKFNFCVDMIVRTLQRIIIHSTDGQMPAALAREQDLIEKWRVTEKLVRFSDICSSMETRFKERQEYNLDPALTLTQLFQTLSDVTKS